MSSEPSKVTRLAWRTVFRSIHLAIAVAVVVACSSTSNLDPLPPADRVVVGEMKKMEEGSAIREPIAIAAAVAFANEMRVRTWSSHQVVHSSCGTVQLTFYNSGKVTGYLGLDGQSFYTNGPKGELQQPASPESVARFLGLLPPRYERSKCVA